MSQNNPLLQDFNTPFGVIPFPKVSLEHYKPAVEQLIAESLAEIDAIAKNPASPTFDNTVVAFERAGEKLNRVVETFFNLNSAETSDEMQALANDISPLMTEYGNEVSQNLALFERVKTVYQNEKRTDVEDKMLLEKSYKGFVRSGANLNDADKATYRELSKAMSITSLKFGENVLAETNSFELVLDNEADLDGLPESAIDAAAMSAKAKGYAGKWLFTLQAPSFMPFMEYATNRTLRENMFRAYASRAYKGDDRDNQEMVKKSVKLRCEKANLLGYASHADYVLEERMALSVDKVNDFLNDLLEKALPKAKQELADIKSFAEQLDGLRDLKRWDWAFYSQKLKNEKFAINDELLRPYFQMEKCVQGIFEVANRLYGLTFQLNKDIPVYHPDVEAYEVLDEKGQHISVLFADFFPRLGKRGGAWMTSFRDQWNDGVDHRPVISMVCNFTPPTESKPSLLTYNEVETLFHEFGHALHGMLANGKYASISGTNVYWDFVELPSQIMENWAQEKECLDLFAKHYQTGESIPQELIQKLKDSSNFQEGSQTLRQLGFALMDMAWHSLKSDELDITDVAAFERQAMSKTNLFETVEGTCSSTQFSHIFQGGYASGYYSYKWAEVLDADAFSLFKEKGIFNREVANAFKDNILSKGGSEHPMELYKRFRGQEPTVEALLERSGLKA